jgi:hypothetical protein
MIAHLVHLPTACLLESYMNIHDLSRYSPSPTTASSTDYQNTHRTYTSRYNLLLILRDLTNSLLRPCHAARFDARFIATIRLLAALIIALCSSGRSAVFSEGWKMGPVGR